MSSALTLTPVSDGSNALAMQGSNMYRYAPEPRNSSGGWARAAQAVSDVGSSLLSGTSVFGNAADITGLLNKQVEIQMIMQVVSMESNISRSKHETEMAPIRNMRIG